MMNRINALKLGFIVDTISYPWVGYKGNRFNPDESVHVYTDLEAWLMKKTGRLAREFPQERIEALSSLKPVTKHSVSFIMWMEEIHKLILAPEHLDLFNESYDDGFTPAEALWERL
jgi:hypothetical protein